MRSRTFALPLLVAIAGCGGGGHAPLGATGRGNGRASITLNWPAGARFIPVSASSVSVVAWDGDYAIGKALQTKVVNRPDGGGASVIELTGLPYDRIMLTVDFYSGPDASGTLQAEGTGQISIASAQPVSVEIAPGTQIKTLSLLPALYELKPGETRQVRVSALNSGNGIVPLSTTDGTRSETIAWNSSAPGVADFASGSNGPIATLSGGSVGTTTLSATFTTTDPAFAAQVVGRADVSAGGGGDHPESALIDGGWATPRGGAGADGMGTVTASPTGSAGSPISVGSGAIGAMVVDDDGNLYASSGSTLQSFRPDGSARWSAPVTNLGTIKDLALTKDGRLYVVGNDLTALSAASGSPDGSFGSYSSGGAGKYVDVAPGGDVVYVAANGVFDLRPTDHALRWTNPTNTANAPAIASDGTVCLRTDSGISSIDGLSGASLRVYSIPALGSFSNSLPGVIVQGGTAVTASLTKIGPVGGSKIYLTDLVSGTTKSVTVGSAGTSASLAVAPGGTVVASVAAPGGPFATAVSSMGSVLNGWPAALVAPAGLSIGGDGTAYVADASNLKAFGIDGALKWSVTLNGTSSGRPAIGPDGTVYVGLTNGTVVPVR